MPSCYTPLCNGEVQPSVITGETIGFLCPACLEARQSAPLYIGLNGPVYAAGHEPERHEAMALFTPAPNQMPGQLSF